MEFPRFEPSHVCACDTNVNTHACTLVDIVTYEYDACHHMGSPKHVPSRQGVQLNMGVHLQRACASVHVLLCMSYYAWMCNCACVKHLKRRFHLTSEFHRIKKERSAIPKSRVPQSAPAIETQCAQTEENEPCHCVVC